MYANWRRVYRSRFLIGAAVVWFTLTADARPLLAQQSVTVATPDGANVPGEIYGTGNRGVVLVAHGGNSSIARWQPQARSLAAAGFRVLVFETRAGVELRKTGKDGECLYDPACMAVDVLAAVRYLHLAGAKTVFVIGGSAGGGAAAHASVIAKPSEIERLVLLAPMSIDNPERIKGRKLFITARDDRNSDGLRLPVIREQYEKTSGPKEFLLLEGSAHAQFIFETTDAERVLREIVRFLSAP